MDRARLHRLLTDLQRGASSVEEALEALAQLPFVADDHQGLNLDTHRALRCGFPEAIYAEGKTDEQTAAAAAQLAAVHDRVLVTRLAAERFAALQQRLPAARYEPLARCAWWRRDPAPLPQGLVCVVCAGASDLPAAAEAVCTLNLMDVGVEQISDVGIAGLPRLLAHLPALRRAQAVVVCAGMEGALPSLVGGLVQSPVIAVPTSVGYGASFGGLAALLAMLNSCAAGVGVVNIGNGFGAGILAGRVARSAFPH